MKSWMNPYLLSPAVLIVGLLAGYLISCSSSQAEAGKNSPSEKTMVKVRVMTSDGVLSEPVEMPKVVMTDEEWKAKLTPEQYRITRSAGTERAFCGGLLKNHEAGVYTCVDCGLPLFTSDAKFESGTGWPSFFQPIAKENVEQRQDESYGMVRTEINCQRCGAHLGHVFDDGPRPTGLRFCLNSEALTFVKNTDLKTIAEKIPATQPAK